MGIYTSGHIFGIRIYTFGDDDKSNTLLERTYEVTMSESQIQEAYLFYKELDNKQNVFFKIYTECSCTYDNALFRMWYPLPVGSFLEKFGV
jgi:hypothetical protein